MSLTSSYKSPLAELSRRWAAENLTRNYLADTAQTLPCRLGECFLVAERESRLVGFVIGEIKPAVGNESVKGVLDDRPGYLDVQDLYVEAQYRHRGVGTMLMRHLIGVAERQGASGSLVYSANRDYVRTARFYEKLGYRMWNIRMTRGGRA